MCGITCVYIYSAGLSLFVAGLGTIGIPGNVSCSGISVALLSRDFKNVLQLSNLLEMQHASDTVPRSMLFITFFISVKSWSLQQLYDFRT